jgi:transcriptional regulator with PAS, ATPase and Fis domain
VENLPLNIRGGQRAATSAAAPLNLEQTERDLILQALEQTRGNRTRAAKLLGISRYTLLYRIKKYFGPEESGFIGEA